MKIRIAAVTLSIAAIITAGVVNTAGAASGPPPVNPVAECTALSCKGALANPTPDPVPASGIVPDDSVKPKAPKPVVVKPAPADEAPEVEAAPVVEKATEPKSGGCN